MENLTKKDYENIIVSLKKLSKKADNLSEFRHFLNKVLLDESLDKKTKDFLQKEYDNYEPILGRDALDYLENLIFWTEHEAKLMKDEE